MTTTEGTKMGTTKRGSDCVYYWVGGREVGEWRQADAGTREGIRRQGYVAHDGRMSIGAPEGPPSEDDFKSVGV